MTGLLALLLPLTALAAERLALPAGESPADWSAALSAAGLVLAPDSGQADAVIRADARGWELLVGGAAPIRVPPARSAETRADLAMLVASLVEPAAPLGWEAIGAGQPAIALLPRAHRTRGSPVSLPAAPAPASKLAAPAPPTALPQLPGEDEPPTPVAASGPSAKPEPPPLPSPAARAPSAPTTLWVGVGALGEAHSDAALWPDLTLGAGLGGARWRCGAIARLGTGAALTTLDGDRGLRSSTTEAGLWWTPNARVELGLLGGVAWRSFLQDGARVAHGAVPVLGADLRTSVPLTRAIALAPGLGVERDLRISEAFVGDSSGVTLSPWAFYAGIWMVVRTPDQQFKMAPHGS